jgi:hypothetical protein
MKKLFRRIWAAFRKNESNQTMMTNTRIEIEAFDDEGCLVARHLFSARQWYFEPQPLVDSDEERSRLRIMRIEGKQLSGQGQVLLRWRSLYAPNGAQIEGWEWDKNGREQYTRLATCPED